MAETISRDNVDTAWLAGVWDGEGCIHTSSMRSDRRAAIYTLRCELRNTSPHLIARVTEILYGWGIKFTMTMHVLHHSPTKRKMLIVIVQSNRGCRELLRKLLPYLTAKKDEAEAMLRYCEWRVAKFGDDTVRGHTEAKRLIQAQVRDKMTALHFELRQLKQRRWSLQRLPRRYSQPFDISRLEIEPAE